MKFFKHLLFTALILANTQLMGVGFEIGPFSLQLGGYSKTYRAEHRNVLDGPVCYAIEHRNQLEISLEVEETVSSKEKKITRKNLVIEPYAFGVSNDDKPILQGNIVKEELIEEVTVKTGEDRFDQPEKSNEKGFSFGIFSSTKIKNLDISKVIHIALIPGSSFEVPKDFKGMDDKNIDIICQLPVAK